MGSTRPGPALSRAAWFLAGHARLLERARFARRFLGAPGEPVLAALLAYRNPDGGFGHALEPDVRAPDSMPLHCELALRALLDAGLARPELARSVCDFLETVAEPEGRVPIVLPAVLDHPRAPHWDHPLFRGDSPNPTAALVGLLRAQGAEHAWLERAEDWCWRRLEAPLADAHEIAAALVFAEHAPDRRRAAALALRLAAEAPNAAFYRADPASGAYGLTPLQLCPTPDALARQGFRGDLLEAHLEALAAAQQEDGGWPIAFDPPTPAAAFEWRGHFTLQALAILEAWGRLPRSLVSDG
jgi:hypothetical protein